MDESAKSATAARAAASRDRFFVNWSAVSELDGSTPAKRIYKAYDEEEGIEVAMHVMKLPPMDEGGLRTFKEALNGPSVQHENLIPIVTSWVDERGAVFITPIITAGTLQGYT
ncbi:hypothetical protein EON68_02305, partial [archaeon]